MIQTMSHLTRTILLLAAVLVIFVVITVVAQVLQPHNALSQPLLRYAFVALGLAIVLIAYGVTRNSTAWQIGTREVVNMGIGASLYAVLAWLFNGSALIVPSVSQVALRPAIAIPMFFGYAFGPAVGFFTGAVGNLVGDALTGFGLSPQWSVGNGLVGLISGLAIVSSRKERSANIAMFVSVALALAGTLFFLTNQNEQNQVYFGAGAGQMTLLAGLSALIGAVMVVMARFIFASRPEVAGAVTWGLMGNFIGIGFAALTDIWINGFSPVTAIVGEFVPAAGPNAIFAVILLPILLLAYLAVRRQSGR
jgi:hypothetical protein